MSCDEQDDPVVEEIRQIREQISARFGHDPERLFQHYVEYSKQFKDQLVTKRDLEERERGTSAAA